jgi:phosphatidylinositol-3-phosphatase
MENHNWAQIKGDTTDAPYINKTLLDGGASCEAYHDSGVHPSLPNYLWIEAGSNLGITSDNVPTATQTSNGEKYLQSTATQWDANPTNHLVTHLDAVGVTWRTYMEGLNALADGGATTCPISDSSANNFATRHNPVLYFSDVVGNPAGSNSARCLAHVKPYARLAADLNAGTVAQYTFITPNLCDDMHNTCTSNKIAQGDAWLSQNVPTIVNSAVFKRDGVLFITWDESENVSGSSCNTQGCPIGMIVLSPFAKAHYSNSVQYTHSSLLRSIEEIFGVTPFTRDAANATDLSDLFTQFP